MKSTLSVIALVVLVIGLMLIGGSFFIVDETKQVVITQFGKPVRKPIVEPGLHVKLPFVQDANYFDKRFLAWDGKPNQIPTKDKRFIWVDTYARWRILDPLLFFQRLRDIRRAQSRLDDILDGETRNTVAKHKLIELVRSTNPKEGVSIGKGYEHKLEPQEEIRFGREVLAKEVLKAAQRRCQELGIEILDFRFKRINYVEAVRKEVYARMISERKRIAEQYRSEGAGQAAKIQGEMQRELKVIRSEAYKKAQEIKGKADAKAADIYASAYNKDPEFYRFLKTMETYKEILDKDTTVVMSTDGKLMKYLEE